MTPRVASWTTEEKRQFLALYKTLPGHEREAQLLAHGIDRVTLRRWSRELRRGHAAPLAQVEQRMGQLEAGLQRAELLLETQTRAISLLLEQLDRSRLARLRTVLKDN